MPRLPRRSVAVTATARLPVAFTAATTPVSSPKTGTGSAPRTVSSDPGTSPGMQAPTTR